MSEVSILQLEDEARLKLTQDTRERIVRELINGGIPKDRDDREFLMKALDGLDRTTLSKAKIKSDDRAAAGQKDAAKLISEVLKRFTVNSNATRRTELPTLDNEHDVDDLVDGEIHVGLQALDYDDFVNK